jgi:adenosylcobinamide-GDP ribazoletransferase
MKKEFRILLTAIQFLTRIRVPDRDYSPEYLRQAPRYFPIAGWLVGAISALFFFICSRVISAEAGVLAAIVAGLLVTGALHEDGFADFCDGFGGGMTKEKILSIMKDSRIGVYGAIGLIAILGAKFILLKEMPAMPPLIGVRGLPAIPVLIAAHSLSRLMAVLVMQTSVYAGDPLVSKSAGVAGRLSARAVFFTLLTGVAPLGLLPWHFWLALLPVVLTAYVLRGYFLRRIGGYTGDCLGAVQQVTEIVTYLGFVLVWRYF